MAKREIWKAVKDYEGLYEVSNFSRVKSLKFGKEKILKPQTDTYGYQFVALFYNSVKVQPKIHRLVAEAFIPNPKNKPEINHLNGKKDDNRVENLEWCTDIENCKHARENGLDKSGSYYHIVWKNANDNTEFMGCPPDLVRTFPGLKLDPGALRRVIRGEQKQHKNWIVKKEVKI